MDIANAIGFDIKYDDKLEIKRSNPHVQSINSHGVYEDDASSANQNTIQDTMVPILASFGSEQVKNQFLGNFRKRRQLFIDDIGIQSPYAEVKKRIFIFEYLIPSLNTKAKSFQKANKYKYLWTKNGSIFLRKGDNTKIIRVCEHSDLSKLVITKNSNTTGENVGDGDVVEHSGGDSGEGAR